CLARAAAPGPKLLRTVIGAIIVRRLLRSPAGGRQGCAACPYWPSTAWRRFTFAILLIPVICGLLATLFWVRGGFGGGHGDFDGWICLLGLPAIAFLEKLPYPRFLEAHDLLLVVWYPATLNLVFVWAPLAFL